MKKKFSKILVVGITLALLTSLVLFAAPVSALSQPSVSLTNNEISAMCQYTIVFSITEALAAGDDIIVEFPEDTDIAAAAVADDDGVSVTPGIGSNAGDVADVTVTVDEDDMTVAIDLTTITGGTPNIGATIGPMAYIQVEITGITNPTEPGDYTLKVKTSEETTYVESESYEIEVPVVGGWVYVYNPSDILLATYGGSAALNDADSGGHFDQEGYTIEVGPGTYVLGGDLAITGKGLTLESSEGAADTIIDADGNGLQINTGAEDVVIDGFTIDDADIGVDIDEDGAIITGCSFEVDVGGTAVVTDHDTTLEYSTFTGSSGTGVLVTAGTSTIEGNTFDSLATALDIDGGTLTIYLNNFTNNTVNVYSEGLTNAWHTPEQITYIYHGNTYTHYLGNHWSDYLGSDSDGDGIGETPYSIDGDNDNCPLMEPFENYTTPSPCFIATASYDAPSNQNIAALRSFRDKVLAKTPLGEALVRVYYSTSPPVAGALAQNEGLRTATRLLLVTPLSYLARTFSHLASFVILAAVVLGLLFLARRRKLARAILKSFGMGISTTAALTATVFSLGYAAYTWPFCGAMAAYILPMIIPLSVAVAVIVTVRPSKTASRSSSPPPPDLPT